MKLIEIALSKDELQATRKALIVAWDRTDDKLGNPTYTALLKVTASELYADSEMLPAIIAEIGTAEGERVAASMATRSRRGLKRRVDA